MPKNKAVINYVLNHPESDGSILLDPEGKVLNWNLGELETIEEFFE